MRLFVIASLVVAAFRPAAVAHSPGTIHQHRTTIADTTHPAPAPTLGNLHPVLGTFHFVMQQKSATDTVFRLLGQVRVDRTSSSGTVTNVASYAWTGGAQTLDTTVSLVATLSPLSERTLTPARMVAYDFLGLRVTGRMGPADSLRPIDDILPHPSFNSTDLDMIVTALPLNEHFRTSVPLYDPEFPGFRMAELKVTGREKGGANGDRDVWVLSFSEIKRATMYYRIDVKSHRMVQKDFGTPGGTQFRVEALD